MNNNPKINNIYLKPSIAPKTNTKESIDKLIQKYGKDYMLNSGMLKNYKFNIPLEVEYTHDQNGNIIISNYDKLKYKYKYIVVQKVMAESTQFIEDILHFLNIDLTKQPKQADGYSFDLNIEDVFFGINDKIEHRNYDILNEEFDETIRVDFDENNKQISKIEDSIIDIDDFLQTIPDSFFTSKNSLFYNEKLYRYTKSSDISILKKKNYNSYVKTILVQFK